MSVKNKIIAAVGFTAGIITGGFIWAGQQPAPAQEPSALNRPDQSASAPLIAVPLVPARAVSSSPPPRRLSIGAIGLSRFAVFFAIFAVVSTALGIAGMKYNTNQQNRMEAVALTGGDPDRGAAAINSYGCGSCHTIPGIHGAKAQVGPPLTGIGNRMFIGGVLPNTPENLQHWIQNPPGIDPQTAMPKLGVSEPDAKDIACYLYTLR
jgi:cytochrome c2